MACNTLSGITFSCLSNTGGLNAQGIYVTTLSSISSFAVDTTGAITAMTMNTGTTFVQIQSTRDTSAFEEDPTINIENGTTFYTQKVDVFVPRRDAAKRNAVLLLAQGQPQLAVVVLDMNGIYWLIGASQGAYLTNAKGGTGKKKSDANGYTLEFTAEEPAPAYVISSSVVSGLPIH